MSDTALAVLMRWPQLGVGKSRLARQVGVEAAHRLHCAFVADTLAWRAPRPRVLAVAPGESAVLHARVAAPDAVVVAQAPGDLGRRIAAALRIALRGGARRVVLVGTDSPSLPHRLLTSCIDLSRRGGAAMVPAEDGGFVALAVEASLIARCGLRWLERGIEWSTERTAAQTIAGARAAGLDPRCTAPWYDVDDSAALDRLSTDLRIAAGRAPRTLRCLEMLGILPALERVS
jgi:glycosyltransferase A (GT-A) superfamily protein (DUF2064 family)